MDTNNDTDRATVDRKIEKDQRRRNKTVLRLKTFFPQ